MGELVLVTYTVKMDAVEENKGKLEKLLADLHAIKIPGVSLCITLANDKQTFTHITYFENPQAKYEYKNSNAFREFQTEMKSRCILKPKIIESTVLSNYNLLSLSPSAVHPEF